MQLKTWSLVGALLMAAGILLGAFGAHALAPRYSAQELHIFEKAVFYHLVHGMSILMISFAGSARVINSRTSRGFCLISLCSIIFFSGSLYALVLSGQRWLGPITPIGGVGFVFAWLFLAVKFRRAEGAIDISSS